MFGLPSLADYLLNISPVTDENLVWILKSIETFYLVSIPYTYPIGLSAQTASVYITMMVTVERYLKWGNVNGIKWTIFLIHFMNVSLSTNQQFIFRYIAVCFPLRSRWIFTLKRTRIGIVFVCIFAILYNVTRFLEYETIVEYIPVSTNINNGDTFKVIWSDIKICYIS